MGCCASQRAVAGGWAASKGEGRVGRWLRGRSFVGQQLGGSVAATVRRLIQEKIYSDFYAFPLIKPFITMGDPVRVWIKSL